MSTTLINGIQVHHEACGSGPNLLMLHGLGSSGADWEHQVEVCAEHYSVLRCDLRGHGRSDKPAGPYSIAGFAADVAGLLDALDIGRTHVMGISMGGMVALQLAADRPELVDHLVIVNSAGEVVPRGLQWLAVWQRLGLARVLGMARVGRAVGGRLFPRDHQQGLRETFESRFAANDKRAYLNAVHAIVGWSLVDRLKDIEAPALWVSGDRDYSPPSVKQPFVDSMPDAHLHVIADSGHATPMDQTVEFNRVVLDFLSSAHPQAVHQQRGDRLHASLGL